ncbi:hypothetical protein Taro_022799 [Colocasia esculenta]|uniref:Pentatricopeptide repeat-containing protein n=1 Tax=Colocasia esculenta TaxID=4460 RepID=A0A843VCJ7_COLES|nr:hypothetical protein [Colocasia esculenta]
MNPWLSSLSPAATTQVPLLRPTWPLTEGRPGIIARLPSPAKRPVATHGNSRVDLEGALRSLEDCSPAGRQGPGNRALYNSLISVCVSERALLEGERLRTHLARVGYEPDVFLENQFINLYAKCGEVGRARELFDGMRERNVVSWNAMIAGYCLNGCFREAALLFATMIETGGEVLNQATYLSTLRASVGHGDLKHGQQLHARLVKVGFHSQLEVGNSLINMYAKLGRPREAEKLFEGITERDAVSWNSAIAASAKNGQCDRALVLFVEMNKEGFMPDEFTFATLLASEDITTVTELHAWLVKHGVEDNIYTGCALLDAYARSGSPHEARLVFNRMPDRNTIAWNSIIAACMEHDMVKEGLQLLMEMRQTGVLPDAYTISSLLGAAIAMESSNSSGKQVHGLAAKLGLTAEASVGNMLIAMYSQQGLVSESLRSFQDTADTDLISWNSMAQACVDNEKYEEALVMFLQMKHSGFEPDKFSFVSALVACASLAWKQTGRVVHGNIAKSGMELDAFTGSALVDMYAKCMAVEEARKVFDAIQHRDLITWNSMLVGSAQNGCLDQALELLNVMREDGFEPDNFTFSGVLSGCADASALQTGRQVHALIAKSDITTDTVVGNALITMYMRSGCTSEASQVFSKLKMRDTASWTAMIGGYAQSGCSREALELFEQMTKSGGKPSGRTFTALLTACSYAGMVHEAEKYFNDMETEYGIGRDLEHYACMVDVLGRAARLAEAEAVIHRMPCEPNALVWRTLLSACKIHGDLARGRRAMERILAMEPEDSAAYVLLSNMYAAVGKWDGVVEVRRLMRENGVRKEPGKSWIEVQNRVHEFVAGDSSHPQKDQIYSALRGLLGEMKAAGYVPAAEE